MLKGEAKTRYMRDYMRRRRAQQAGQPRLQVDPAVGDPATSEVRQRLEARVGELEAEVARLTAENVQLRAKKHLYMKWREQQKKIFSPINIRPSFVAASACKSIAPQSGMKLSVCSTSKKLR
jgi:hypothetical protein